MNDVEILTENEVSRIRHSYDPSGSMSTDIFALSESHEAVRTQRDLLLSIAERYADGWSSSIYRPLPRSGAEPIFCWVNHAGNREPMTPEQVAWFQEREQ
jgi:hypothetical protein